VAVASLDERNIVRRIDGVYRELGLRPSPRHRATTARPGKTTPPPAVTQPEGVESI
jgi:hypothetical protein